MGCGALPRLRSTAWSLYLKMSNRLITKTGHLHSSISGEYGHLLSVSVSFGYEKDSRETCGFDILLPTKIRSWKELDMHHVGIKPEYIIANGEVISGNIDINIRNIEANIFKVELNIYLDNSYLFENITMQNIAGKFKAKYYSISIKESSSYNSNYLDPEKLEEVINTCDYLIKQPMHQFNGAIGFAVKI